jgi:hypothetical protein
MEQVMPSPNTLSVDTKTITPRNSLPVDFFALCQYMHDADWEVKITTDNHIESDYRPRVSAAANSWNGLVVSGYCFGYLAENNSQDAIIGALRRLAELCLRLEETFTECLPDMVVDQDGFIHTHQGLSSAAEKGNGVLLRYICDHYRRGEQKEKANDLTLVNGFIHFNWDSDSTLFSEREVDALHELVAL